MYIKNTLVIRMTPVKMSCSL